MNDTLGIETLEEKRRSFRRRWLGPMPVVAGAVGAIALLAAWRAALDPDRHSPVDKFDPMTHHFFDVEGAIAPLYLAGDEGDDALLILGDSRAASDISQRVLAQKGIEPVCLLWNGFAQLDELLRAASSLPQRRLLVTLDPSGVYVAPIKRMAVILAQERQKRLTQRIDDRLDDLADVFRQRMVRTIERDDWTIGRFESTPQPDRLVGTYRGLMGEEFRAVRQEHFEALRQDLRSLRDAGRRIVCVRLPASTAIEAIENDGFRCEQFREMCTELGFPYLDLTGRNYKTADGTHLLGPDAEEMTVVLADWLRTLP